MLNAAAPVLPSTDTIAIEDPGLIEAMAPIAQINTETSQILANIASSIRRGYPQMPPGPGFRSERVCLVGSGPTLPETEAALRQLVYDGAQLVTLNGAYHWCLSRGFRPQTQVVIDARPFNARFVTPRIPRCNYLLASQCAPETWDAVEGHPYTWIFHPVSGDPEIALLDAYYGGRWIACGGGSTVATRAIWALHMAGYVRFDLFGIDCCWLGKSHHAIPQPENAGNTPLRVRFAGDDHVFTASPWMVQQARDVLDLIGTHGQSLSLTVHGRGLLAHLLRTGATLSACAEES